MITSHAPLAIANGTIPTESAPLLNLTAPTTPPSSNGIDIKCGYGTSLNYDSCVDAFNTFRETRTTNLTIGDGLCTFDIVKKGSDAYALATALEIQAAAVSLLNLCLKDRGGQGGVAVNVGVGGNVGVILRPYDPGDIVCGGTGPRALANDCALMGQTMAAAASPSKRWGPATDPLTEEELPMAWALTPPKQCLRALSITDPILSAWDTSSYFDIWQAFVAVIE
ncbi:hypothetical protein P7C71_g2938, partial [Lecanoromycetidae sp. Uapishka_2]